MRWTPRHRSIFFTVNILILVLPLGGIVLLRLYESVLIRRTESELIVQGAHVGASYLSAVREELARRGREGDSYGVSIDEEHERRADQSLQPFEAKLDLATDKIFPPPELARHVDGSAEPVARIAGERITQALREAQKITLAGIRVTDPEGVVVATTRTELGMSLAHREEARRALTGEHISLMRQRISDEPSPPLDSISRGTRLRVFVAVPITEGNRVFGAVILSRTPQAVSQSLYVLRWHIFGGALSLLAMIALISLITSRTITRPMEELIRQSERVANGERGAATPLTHSGTLEVQRVSEAISRMAQALEERAEYINTFARGVSHEFKTPLSSIRGALELLRDHFEEMTPDERNRFLGNLEQDAERLTRLVSRLTDLARADVIKPTLAISPVVSVIDDILVRFRNDELDVTACHSDDVSFVKMERETLEAIVTNLIENARQHGGQSVVVTVRTGCSTQGSTGEALVVIEVEDNGPGISEANRDRVFDRFFTTARDRGGSGLGLSIVKSLVRVHGGDITLTSQTGRTVFRLELLAVQEGEPSERAHL